MHTGFSRNPAGEQSRPVKLKGAKLMAAASKTKNKSGAKNKSAHHNTGGVKPGYHLVKNPTKKNAHKGGGYRRNPVNLSADIVKLGVGILAAATVGIVTSMIPINQANPMVRGGLKIAAGFAGAMFLSKNPAIAEGVLMGAGIAGGLDIVSGVLPGLGGQPQQQQIIQVPMNPSQVAPGGLTPKTAHTVNAIRRQLNGGNLRSIRMVTGNPAMFSPYQYVA